jgi:hypothetical protein
MLILIACQYWVTSYETDFLKGDKDTVYIVYIITILSGPSVGSLAGGIVATRLLGSYTNPKTLHLCLAFYLTYLFLAIGSTL